MPNVVNCKKCGALYLQTSKRDICDKCFEAQNKLISEMNSYVIVSPDETVPLDQLLEKFGMPRAEFEDLYSAGKFVRVAKKVTMVCTSCGNTVPLENKTGSICASCARKLQNQL